MQVGFPFTSSVEAVLRLCTLQQTQQHSRWASLAPLERRQGRTCGSCSPSTHGLLGLTLCRRDGFQPAWPSLFEACSAKCRPVSCHLIGIHQYRGHLQTWALPENAVSTGNSCTLECLTTAVD